MFGSLRAISLVLIVLVATTQVQGAYLHRHGHTEACFKANAIARRDAPSPASPDASALTSELGTFRKSLQGLSKFLTNILAEIGRLKALLGPQDVSRPLSKEAVPALPGADVVSLQPLLSTFNGQDLVPTSPVPSLLGNGIAEELPNGLVIVPVPQSDELQPSIIATTLDGTQVLTSPSIASTPAIVVATQPPATSILTGSRSTKSPYFPLPHNSTYHRTSTALFTQFSTSTTSFASFMMGNISTPAATGNSTPTNMSPAPSPESNGISTSNIAVYFGQRSNQASDLLTLCSNPAVGIVALAFLDVFHSPQSNYKYPSTAFGNSCQGSNPAQLLTAPGLQNCSQLGQYITQCQKRYNTKILVSLGGYIASSSFKSANDATAFAEMLWNLFGAGKLIDPELRPFGYATVDGFDVDNEDHNTAYWGDFASALRSQYAKDKTRKYYLSAAPQCPRPDQSIPSSLLNMADFVFVQFYNNPPCNLGTSGFVDSVKAWSSDLSNGATGTGSSPLLYVGMPAWSGGGSGYLAPGDMAKAIGQVKSLALKNFGGIMMWDGSEALTNVDSSGNNYIAAAKKALNG